LLKIAILAVLVAIGMAAAGWGCLRFWQVDDCQDHGGAWHHGRCDGARQP
jgi:hypothetical protein